MLVSRLVGRLMGKQESREVSQSGSLGSIPISQRLVEVQKTKIKRYKKYKSTVYPKQVYKRIKWGKYKSQIRVAKCQFFTQTKIWIQNFTPKTCNSQLICFCDKTRKSWSIQVVVGLVCYGHRPIGYLHRIWVECKCVWVKITHWNIEFRIWAKCTGVWGKIAPTILAVFIKLYPTSERVCYNQRFYPRPPKIYTD